VRVREILGERGRIAAALLDLAARRSVQCEVFPSDANFLLVRFGDGAEALCEALAKGEPAVLVRFRGKMRSCAGCVRISIGTRTENNALLRALELVL